MKLEKCQHPPDLLAAMPWPNEPLKGSLDHCCAVDYTGQRLARSHSGCDWNDVHRGIEGYAAGGYDVPYHPEPAVHLLPCADVHVSVDCNRIVYVLNIRWLQLTRISYASEPARQIRVGRMLPGGWP